MNAALARLLSVGSDPLGPVEWGSDDEHLVTAFGAIGLELLHVLRCKNGFYAFEAALHVFPLAAGRTALNIASWNAPHTWREDYGELVPGKVLFFAQDVFGDSQFGIQNDRVVRFNSECATIDPVAESLGAWAEILIADWPVITGYPLAHEWQVRNRPLADGERLIPKVPFVIGGEYEVENLYAGNIVEAMRFRGSLARQLVNVPDGTPVEIVIRGGQHKS
jgi:hypothetical protein